MPYQQIIERSWESRFLLWTKKHQRKYIVTYTEDAAGRSEAVTFFNNALFPAMNLPSVLDKMPMQLAQKHLDDNPMQKQWSMLTLNSLHQVDFIDKDLYRLKFFPELERLRISSSQLTDQGVSFIPLIPQLRHLRIYSPLVTDESLKHISKLSKLQTIDLQLSPLITRKAFDKLVATLPELQDIYPPHNQPSS